MSEENKEKSAANSNEGAALSLPPGAKFEITLEDGEKLYLRAINRVQLGIVLSLIMPSSGQPDYIRAGEVILENCAIKTAGDYEAIKADEMLFVGACFQAFQIVELKTGTIKKL
jgi:hypothetical protein|tara:strand:- start:28 stop:369 length:342 start_codon:yes stop_codon:yes gene_type:complete